MSDIRLSAIITTYNCQPFVADAIESVLSQTLPADEILLIDDGSTDDTYQIVSKYIGVGVRYIFQPNQGAGAARNLGIQESKGAFIAFLDADDLWLEDKSHRQLEILLANPGVSLVSGQGWWWNINTGKRREVRQRSRGSAQGRRDILIHNWIGNPSMVMLRRSALDQIGMFDPTLRWGQDWDLWIRIVSRFPVVVLPDPVIIYRSHPKNLSHTNRWERIESLWGISRRAIASFQPAWWRPILLVRAWSHLLLQRAGFKIKEGDSRLEQIVYAFLALVSFPIESGGEKLMTLARALVGERVYQWSRQRFKTSARDLNG